MRLLPAEVLLDAISQVLDVPERVRRPHPGRLRAAQLPGVAGGGAFLKTFGKPERLLTCECERSESTTLAQAFQMINGDDGPAQAGGDRTTGSAGCSTARPAIATILTELYLAALCREPTAAERQAILAHVQAQRRRPPQRLGRRRLGAPEQQGIPAPALRLERDMDHELRSARISDAAAGFTAPEPAPGRHRGGRRPEPAGLAAGGREGRAAAAGQAHSSSCTSSAARRTSTRST